MYGDLSLFCSLPYGQAKSFLFCVLTRSAFDTEILREEALMVFIMNLGYGNNLKVVVE